MPKSTCCWAVWCNSSSTIEESINLSQALHLDLHLSGHSLLPGTSRRSSHGEHQDAPEIVNKASSFTWEALGYKNSSFSSSPPWLSASRQKSRSRNNAISMPASDSMTEYCSPRQARKLLHVVYVVLGLISLRIIFRPVEFSQGFDTYLPTHKWVPYVFDASPMLAALICLNFVHPGRILKGPNSDFTEERKADKQKKEKKEAKKAEKIEMRELKQIGKRNRKASKAAYKRAAKTAVTMIV